MPRPHRPGAAVYKQAKRATSNRLKWESTLVSDLGAQYEMLCGPVDQQGTGHPVITDPSTP